MSRMDYCRRQTWVPQIDRLTLRYVALALIVMLASAFVVMQSAQAVDYRVLHRFTGGVTGTYPISNLVYDGEGSFYAATLEGGIIGGECSGGCGTVYKVSKDGQFSVLYKFLGGTDGYYPGGNLVLTPAGIIYGTTQYGGYLGGNCGKDGGCGTVFKLDKAGNHTVLYRFKGEPDGADPQAGVIQGADGNLYGPTFYGGRGKTALCLHVNIGEGCGTVFEVDTSGKETVLYRFSGHQDGKFPVSLIQDSEGNLYGTNSSGGDYKGSVCKSYGCGTVFRLSKTLKLTVLHTFDGEDGEDPLTLVQDVEGSLYVASFAGGTGSGNGTVFKISKTGKGSLFHTFSCGANGGDPTQLIQDGKGNFYGTTDFCGFFANGFCDVIGCGVVFKLDKTGKETVLHSFTGGKDGAFPSSGLYLDSSGNLYSTTMQFTGDLDPDPKGYKCCRGTVYTLGRGKDSDSEGSVP